MHVYFQCGVSMQKRDNEHYWDRNT
jgi:hypothetical protein